MDDDEHIMLAELVQRVAGPPEIADDDNLVSVLVEQDRVVLDNEAARGRKHERRPRVAQDEALDLVGIGHQVTMAQRLCPRLRALTARSAQPMTATPPRMLDQPMCSWRNRAAQQMLITSWVSYAWLT